MVGYIVNKLYKGYAVTKATWWSEVLSHLTSALEMSSMPSNHQRLSTESAEKKGEEEEMMLCFHLAIFNAPVI